MFGSESCSASVVWTSGLLLPFMFISHKLQRNAYLLLFIWQLLLVIILVLCVQIFRYLWHFFQYEGQKWDLIVALTGFCCLNSSFSRTIESVCSARISKHGQPKTSAWLHSTRGSWICIFVICVNSPFNILVTLRHVHACVCFTTSLKTKGSSSIYCKDTQSCIYMSCPLEGRQTLCSVKARHQQDVIIYENFK